MKILFVIPSLGYCGAAKQLSLLAPALRERFETRVCVLGKDGPFGGSLRQAGVPVEVIGWRYWVDLGALHRLRQAIAVFQPDCLHLWRPAWLRKLEASLGWIEPEQVIIPCSPPGNRSAILHHLLLGHGGSVVVTSDFEADRCRRGGVSEERIIRVRPAVLCPEVLPPVRSERGKATIVCIGPLEAHKGYVDAMWSFDILRFVEDAVELLLIGDGTQRRQLERFVGITRTQGKVHLLGVQPDIAPHLAQADLVCVPSRAPGGVNVALEAMALGRPVIATRVPGLTEIVIDGETGFLIAPGDKIALARRTRQLLHDPALRQRFGAAGRRRVLEHFTVPALVERLLPVYEGHALRA